MISGPRTPRTKEGLRQLLRSRPDLLERGLRVAVEDVDFSAGALGTIDALLRDAGGRAVLLLLSDGDADPRLPARLADGLAFVQRSGQALQRAMPEAQLRFEPPYRALVAGFRLHPDLVDRLRSLNLPDCHACEVEPFVAGGVERIVVRWLLRPVETASGPGFSVPAGLLPAAARTRCEKILRTLERLDPHLQVEGDRFSRRVLHAGRTLCEIWVEGDELRVSVGDEAPQAVTGDAQVLQLADSVLRRYLAMDRGATEATTEASPDAAAATAPIAPRSVLAMESLRRSVLETRVSREEFSALGQSATEGKVPDG